MRILRSGACSHVACGGMACRRQTISDWVDRFWTFARLDHTVFPFSNELPTRVSETEIERMMDDAPLVLRSPVRLSAGLFLLVPLLIAAEITQHAIFSRAGREPYAFGTFAEQAVSWTVWASTISCSTFGVWLCAFYLRETRQRSTASMIGPLSLLASHLCALAILLWSGLNGIMQNSG